ncbi:DUF185-domain-containing protein [Phellopilus nigrolimitatus]|nr:DUF185-domain-containing protein [Phellopilus nigrolimitatus]
MYSWKLAGSASSALRVRARRRFSAAHALRYVSTSQAARQPTNVEKIVRDTIKATGPMSVSTYMSLCLGHPTEGYYTNPANPVFGTHGDFITSPEISQVFGELLAVWHLSRWLAAGAPPRIRVVELGPGRGTLAADALRTWAQFPACAAAIRELYLVETSPPMRALQRKTLAPLLRTLEAERGQADVVRWRDSLEDVAENTHVDAQTFTMVLAHEFFDALPVHVLEKCEDGWHEIQITTASDPTSKTIIKNPLLISLPSPLHFARSPAPTPIATLMGGTSPRFAALPIGARLEVSPAGFKIARQVAELVNHPEGAGGSALIIDYGKDTAFGNSLRAFRKHKVVDVFELPGHCDLTANVDFAFLKEAIGDAATSHGPIPQRAFLQNMNIEARVAQLTLAARQRKANADADALAVARAARRLVDPAGMGEQYKVLGVTGTGVRALADGEETVWPFVPDLKR